MPPVTPKRTRLIPAPAPAKPVPALLGRLRQAYGSFPLRHRQSRYLRSLVASVKPTAHAGIVPAESLLLGVLVDDLALGDLFEGHRQVVLRARLDQRRRELIECALAQLVVVVVDLPGALGRDDHQRVARVDLLHQFVDAGMNHGRGMVAAARSSRVTISDRRSAAAARS